MLGTNKQHKIIEIARMFKTKVKLIPSRPGERFRSTKKNNFAYLHLRYRAQKNITEYIKSITKQN